MRAEINIPRTVMVPWGAKTVDVEVLCSLHNEAEDHRVLAPPSSGGGHFWHLLNRNQREVQRRPAGEAETASQLVGSGLTHAHPETVTLNAAKLKNGETYTLRFRLFGLTAEGDFTVFHQMAPPAKPATKKAKKKAKKKVAKKKVAKKKAAKKKTAKKKAAKRTYAARRSR